MSEQECICARDCLATVHDYPPIEVDEELSELLAQVKALRDELEKFADEAEKDAADILSLRAERDQLRLVIRTAGCTCNDYATISPHATQAERARLREDIEAYEEAHDDIQNISLIALVPEMKKALLDAARESHECLTPGDGCVVCVARKIEEI